MVTLSEPVGINVMGNINVLITPVCSLTAPDLSAEINHASALDITQILYASGWKPERSQNVVTAPRRLGSVRQFQKFGLVNETFPNLKYVWDPQGAVGAVANKAYELLVPGASLFAVMRIALPETQAFAVDDWVRVAPIKPGIYGDDFDPTDEAAEYMVDQQLIIRSPGWGDRVKIVA